MAWTTDDLVSAVKRKCMAPPRWQFTDQQVLDVAWEELMKRLVPVVRGIRQNYWTTTTDIEITSGDSTYRLPSRAAASTSTSVWCVLTNGDLVKLTRVPAADRMRLSGANGGEPRAYSLEGNTLYLYPTPNVSGMTLRVQYDRRPSLFVLTSTCWSVDFQPLSNTIEASGPAADTNFYDIVQANPPCDLLVDNQEALVAAGPTFTFDSSVDLSDVRGGDYLALTGYTCVPPLPDVLHTALADFTAAAIKSEMGDYQRAVSLRAEIAEYLPDLLQTLAVRVGADPQLAVNPESALRSGRSGGWGLIRG